MKKILLLVLGLASSYAFGQDVNYRMFETMYLRPKSDKIQLFEKNLAAHNQKFHASGPYSAWVRFVENGPRSGEYVWVMGPCTYTDLDNRPKGDDHKNDWILNISPTLEYEGYAEYWRYDDKLSSMHDTLPHAMQRVRIMDIARGQWPVAKALIDQISNVVKTKKYPNNWGVYFNDRWNGNDGRDVAFVTSFDKWAFLDQKSTFKSDFESIYGEGSWAGFIQNWETAFDGEFEELRSDVPKLSGKYKPAATKTR